MKIERLTLDNETGNYCEVCEQIFDSETETYSQKSEGEQGYRVGYTTYCTSCLKGIMEAVKILESNKNVKRVEI